MQYDSEDFWINEENRILQNIITILSIIGCSLRCFLFLIAALRLLLLFFLLLILLLQIFIPFFYSRFDLRVSFCNSKEHISCI